MDSVTNLNASALTYITEGNLEGMQQCVANSIQPKMILQAMFDSKRYECLPAIEDLLRTAFKTHEQIATKIYVDLLERKELAEEIPFPVKGKERILNSAVERKVAIDFTLCHPRSYDRVFELSHQKHYYYQILTQDCLELFLICKEDILSFYDEDFIFNRPGRHFFPRILKELCVTEELCRKSLTIALNMSSFNTRNEKHYEELLLHIYTSCDCRDKLYSHLFIEINRIHLVHYKSMLKLAASFDPRIAPKLAQVDLKLHAELFGEDV